jgi:hypothetical protein
MYKDLDADKIIETLERLYRRILERFPGSGLSRISDEVLSIAKESGRRSEWIRKPIIPLRIGVALIIFSIIAVTVYFTFQIQPPDTMFKLSEFIQVLEAGINDLVLIGAAIFFLLKIELKVKRNRASKLINELRSFAHVIDMHQLTKDPEGFKPAYIQTESSPQREMSSFEINRYLDYCSELLSLVGKIAALYAQNFDDQAFITSVKDIEDLTTGLSRKIWQKIIILQSLKEK